MDLSPFEQRFTKDDPNLRNLFYLDWHVAGARRAFEEAKVRLEKKRACREWRMGLASGRTRFAPFTA